MLPTTNDPLLDAVLLALAIFGVLGVALIFLVLAVVIIGGLTVAVFRAFDTDPSLRRLGCAFVLGALALAVVLGVLFACGGLP